MGNKYVRQITAQSRKGRAEQQASRNAFRRAGKNAQDDRQDSKRRKRRYTVHIAVTLAKKYPLVFKGGIF